jgi:hypothetical protein
MAGVTVSWSSGVAALSPISRPANAFQSRHWLAPPLSIMSAARIPSRASRNDALAGVVFFMPSITSCSVWFLPMACRMSQSAAVQISPSRCGSHPPFVRVHRSE